MRKMIRDYIQRQENKGRLDWQNNPAKSEKETRGRVTEWGRGVQDARKAASLPLKTLQAACIYTACHSSLDPTDGACSTLKKIISKDATLFLSLSIASNIDASMMSINMFKLAVRDLRCITHSFPSLCTIFEMPHFIRNGPTRIWVWNWWEDENKQLSSVKPSHNENLLPNMQPPQFFFCSHPVTSLVCS